MTFWDVWLKPNSEESLEAPGSLSGLNAGKVSLRGNFI
jgi:hypothetical protein